MSKLAIAVLVDFGLRCKQANSVLGAAHAPTDAPSEEILAAAR